MIRAATPPTGANHKLLLLSWACARPLLTAFRDARGAPPSAPGPPLRVTGSHADRAWFLPLLAILFMLSGIRGLIYQTLWLRLLSLVFGVTIYAASTVLASFTGGLALGTVLAGRLTTRARSPLAWLGVVELGIGAAAPTTGPLSKSIARCPGPGPRSTRAYCVTMCGGG